jgi:hypothetical protein
MPHFGRGLTAARGGNGMVFSKNFAIRRRFACASARQYK